MLTESFELRETQNGDFLVWECEISGIVAIEAEDPWKAAREISRLRSKLLAVSALNSVLDDWLKTELIDEDEMDEVIENLADETTWVDDVGLIDAAAIFAISIRQSELGWIASFHSELWDVHSTPYASIEDALVEAIEARKLDRALSALFNEMDCWLDYGVLSLDEFESIHEGIFDLIQGCCGTWDVH